MFLVTGATGSLGRRIVQQLREQETPVRAFVRLVSHYGDANNRSSIVSTDDLAKIAIDSVTVEGAKNQILPVGGPQILKRDDLPRIFGRIFKREPIIINVPLMVLDTLRTGIGFFNRELESSLGTLRTLLNNEFFCSQEEIANLESIYSLKLESLEDFLKRYLDK
jgi:uncharacterized protein YbjT (DUF2867 family)